MIESWLGSLRARGQRFAAIETKRRHIARSNPGPRPEDLTVEYALAWSAAQDGKPEIRHGYYGSFKSFLVLMSKTTDQSGLVEMPRVR